jgi:undecaprenyl-phosphate 4-deoxy-4-formamido-L-arabinose transferase
MLPNSGPPQGDSAPEPRTPDPGPQAHSLAVVIPVYQGENTLEAVVAEIEPLTHDETTPGGQTFRVVEVTLVHDGAIDQSDQVMEALARRFPFVRLVWLSRNFGQHPALLAGMAATSADWIVTMDEDGQHNAQDIAKMLDVACSEAAQLVYAKPTNEPPHSWLRNRLSNMAKWLFVKALSAGTVGYFHSFRLLDGEVGRSLAAYCGNSVYLDVALGWVVDRQAYCPVAVRVGIRRPSGYTFANLARHFLRLVLTSGTRPLRFITLLGMFSFLLAVGISVFAAFQSLTSSSAGQGGTATIIVICFFAGCILFSLGIIAEYLGVVLTMSMGKPLYLVVSRPRRRKGAP